MELSWHLLMRQANHIHSKRNENLCLDFSGYSDRRPITDGYFSANENRFTKLDTKMIKANDPEIYNVKIDKFSRRSE